VPECEGCQGATVPGCIVHFGTLDSGTLALWHFGTFALQALWPRGTLALSPLGTFRLSC